MEPEVCTAVLCICVHAPCTAGVLWSYCTLFIYTENEASRLFRIRLHLHTAQLSVRRLLHLLWNKHCNKRSHCPKEPCRCQKPAAERKRAAAYPHCRFIRPALECRKLRP